MTTSPYLDALRKRVLVYDGAMGTSVQNLELPAEDFGGKEGCNEILVLTAPHVIGAIHRSFLEAGADVLETDTFGGSRLKLDEYGLGERTVELNRQAAALARGLADEFSTADWPRFVAGSMGPTGMLPSSDDPTLGNMTYDELAAIFAEQAQGLVEGGCDLLLIETSQDILEVKAAIAGIRRYFAAAGRWVPIQAQVTLDTSGRMLLGTDIGAVLVILEALGVDVIGLNCSTGPQHMREPVRYLCANSRLPISVIPNAGLPLNVGGRAVYPLEPVPMAEQLAAFVAEFGVNVVGGCCGTTPEHIRQLRERIERTPALARSAPDGLPCLASPIHAVALVQEPPPMLVGERVNTLGSRRVKRLLLNDRYDEVVAIARDQVEGGAHALDVCVATTDRTDEADQMRLLVKKLGMSVEAPLMIDSTEPEVVEAALKTYGGRAIINSINMENGRAKIDAVLPMAREHGAAVVAMTIDERGMARTADRKLEVARRIYDIATQEFGLPPHALVFDTQVLPLSTGQEEERNAGVETINGIRRVKAELPGALTVLGISNVSFGLGEHARAVLNSVFLHHAVEAGLDLAIVNPKDVVPYAEIPIEQRSLTDDVVFNRHAEALGRFVSYFEKHAPAPGTGEAAANPMEGLSVPEQIHYQILHRIKDGIEGRLDAALLERTQSGAGHRLRRRARHRQEPGQHDPDEQRVYRLRPGQAGAAEHDHRQGDRRAGGRHRALRAARLHLQADAAVRAGAAQARAVLPRRGRRGSHQPRLRLPHPVRRRAGSRATLRAGCLLCQGRL
jgi:5-methyltetrahydrofolate--homocysteine methyltransferase